MPKQTYPDNFKIEIVNFYNTHKDVIATLEKYNIARSSLFKWKKQHENQHFSRPKKEKNLLSPQARSHLQKIDEVIAARKEAGCPITASTEAKIAAIERLGSKYSVYVRCEAVQLPRGTYYNRMKRATYQTKTDKEDAIYRPLIRQIFESSDERYGWRPIMYKMRELGYYIDDSRIARLMREMGLTVKQPAFARHHAKPLPRMKYSNLVNRDFSPDHPNKVWVSDITYVKVNKTYYFICVVMDLFSRKVLSYGISDSIDTVLTLNAFDDAFISRRKPKGVIFHSDQGVQYTAYLFRDHLRNLKVKQSFSSPGCPYDNAVCETFFHTLKRESVHRYCYTTEEELEKVVDAYISFYNDQRLHSTLNMKTPSQYETEFCCAVQKRKLVLQSEHG